MVACLTDTERVTEVFQPDEKTQTAIAIIVPLAMLASLLLFGAFPLAAWKIKYVCLPFAR